MGRSDGLTKLIVEPETNRILGRRHRRRQRRRAAGRGRPRDRGRLDAEDVALTIHPHPTLSETIGFSAEQAEGTITDIMPKRKAQPKLT